MEVGQNQLRLGIYFRSTILFAFPGSIECMRFGKILTCFPYFCSVSVNFVFKFLPQLALASSKYQMLSAPCFLFVLFCIPSFTTCFRVLHH